MTDERMDDNDCRHAGDRCDGSNYTQLAVRYGLTETWIRTIVMEKARELRQKPIDGQISMFDL